MMDDKHLHIEQWLKDAAQQSAPDPTGMDMKRQAWSKMSGLLDASAAAGASAASPAAGPAAAPARTILQKVWAAMGQATVIVPTVAAAAVISIVAGVLLYHNMDVQTKQKQGVTNERQDKGSGDSATGGGAGPVADSGAGMAGNGMAGNVVSDSSSGGREGITKGALNGIGAAGWPGASESNGVGNSAANAAPGRGEDAAAKEAAGNNAGHVIAGNDRQLSNSSLNAGNKLLSPSNQAVTPAVDNKGRAGRSGNNAGAGAKQPGAGVNVPNSNNRGTGANNRGTKPFSVAGHADATGQRGEAPSSVANSNGDKHSAVKNNREPERGDKPANSSLTRDNDGLTALRAGFRPLRPNNPFIVEKPVLSSGSRGQHIPYSSLPPAKRAWQADGSRWAMQAGVLLPVSGMAGASAGSALGIRLGALYNLPLWRNIYLQPSIGLGYITGYDKRFTHMGTGRDEVRDSVFVIDSITTPYTLKKAFVGNAGINLNYTKGRWSVGTGITFSFVLPSGVQDTSTHHQETFRDTSGQLGPVTPATFNKSKLPGLRSLGWNLDAAYYVLPRLQVGINYKLFFLQPGIDPSFSNVPDHLLGPDDDKNKYRGTTRILDKSMLEFYIRIPLGR
ncbi:hypothetical protein F0L74_20015 [Chitinophaga agrisoli]|uniref:Uncharacterized protein n=1 Tax=Chitinophaga agrisoli TaxID=2607653 RepID=A0A5B2VJG7_9BACT|nr:hypothetical protein [Chitinophaga agrisoli]KAA2238512.1 hypothetical protein F0L74_20015 [Chitinophaga agrisoli]